MDDYYKGPLNGYTNEEMAKILGEVILEALDREGMTIVWKHK